MDNLIKHFEEKYSTLQMQLASSHQQLRQYQSAESSCRITGVEHSSYFVEHQKQAASTISYLEGATRELKYVLEMLEYEQLKKEE